VTDHPSETNGQVSIALKHQTKPMFGPYIINKKEKNINKYCTIKPELIVTALVIPDAT